MRRIGKITGRSDDMLIIRGVNVFPTQIEELLLQVPELAPIYLIEVSKDGNLDMVTVSVELNPESSELDESGKDDVMARLKHLVKTYVGISIKVKLVGGEGLARSEGKAKRVHDYR